MIMGMLGLILGVETKVLLLWWFFCFLLGLGVFIVFSFESLSWCESPLKRVRVSLSAGP